MDSKYCAIFLQLHWCPMRDTSRTFLQVCQDGLNVPWRNFLENQGLNTRELFASSCSDRSKFDGIYNEASAPQASFGLRAKLLCLWETCVAQAKGTHDHIAKMATDSLEENLDDPLTNADKDNLLRSFKATYKIVLRPSECPTANLMGRAFKECKARTNTFVQLPKVKSLISAQLKESVSKEKIGHLTVSFGGDTGNTPVPVEGVLDFISRLEILTNAYAISGTTICDDLDGNPMWCSLQEAHDYVLQFKDALKRIHVSKAIEADETMRKAVVDKVQNEQMRLGAALREVSIEYRSLLQGNDRKGKGNAGNDGGKGDSQKDRTIADLKRKLQQQQANMGKGGKYGQHTPQQHLTQGGGKGNFSNFGSLLALTDYKKPRKTGDKNLPDGRQICKRWNDKRGCEQKAGRAPCHHVHACDVVIDDHGSLCMSTEHNRLGHPK
jgi:hypothetical protein